MLRNFILQVALIFVCSWAVSGQTSPRINDEQRAALTEKTMAHDVSGVLALTGRLRTPDLHGSIDSPVVNVRVVITNESSLLFSYVSGWATFYDGEGVRCGEGLFKISALAPSESSEIDTPGLRLICSPATWRIIATNLLTNAADVAKPAPTQPAKVVPSPAPAKPAQ